MSDKITELQHEKLKSLISNIESRQFEIGLLEFRKHQLLNEMIRLDSELNEFKKELELEYGNVSVNIQNGEINYK
jgi:hypothetical protein